MFVDKHLWKNMMEYQKKFLEEKKSLLPYFIKFKEDDRILHKKYSDNCIIRSPD